MKNILLILSAAGLGACSSNVSPLPQSTIVDDTLKVYMKEAISVRKGLLELKAAENEKAVIDLQALPLNFHRKVNIQWHGPVAPLLSKLADAAGYSFHVVGNPPSTELLVRLSKHQRSIADTLEDVILQISGRATVEFDIGRGRVELRFNVYD